MVLPVSLIEQRPGTFVNWEGRDRGFEAVDPAADRDERPPGAGRAGRRARCRPRLPHRRPRREAELDELGAWDGAAGRRPDHRCRRAGDRPASGEAVLATWRMDLDDSSAVADEPYLLATARPPVAPAGPGDRRGRRDRRARHRSAPTAARSPCRSRSSTTWWPASSGLPARAPRSRRRRAPGGRGRRPRSTRSATGSTTSEGSRDDSTRSISTFFGRPLVGGADQGRLRLRRAAGDDAVHHLVRAPRGRV